jgi:hypothetical protein
MEGKQQWPAFILSLKLAAIKLKRVQEYRGIAWILFISTENKLRATGTSTSYEFTLKSQKELSNRLPLQPPQQLLPTTLHEWKLVYAAWYV